MSRDIYEQAFVKALAGFFHAIALKSDGIIAGRRSNFNGESNPPAGNNFVNIAAGKSLSLSIKSGGTIIG